MTNRCWFAIPAVLLALAGCDGVNNPPIGPAPMNDPEPDPPATREFQVSVLNLTAGQPLSPIALILHDSSWEMFQLGAPASVAVETLAEGGDNSMLLDEADGDAGVVATTSAGGPLPPGATELLTISAEEDSVDLFSMMTMLVNTNDAITAARNISIASLDVGERIEITTLSYDAGTEANSELAGTIPGPADGGEGFNAARDDIADEVRGHSGVVTSDDGHSDSVLTQAHRWDNPVARVIITRID
ncbi:MAG: spondin domain-containing protein [Proteobacteria bacterium]|jgi:hypothetical protein|nr:spondin domain-containing protein [Pseudomonadota bacterium]MDA1299555.1 spondin domain-containing protein [Pseudomonadota bacterium]